MLSPSQQSGVFSSQNHRMFGTGRNLEGKSNATPCQSGIAYTRSQETNKETRPKAFLIEASKSFNVDFNQAMNLLADCKL